MKIRILIEVAESDTSKPVRRLKSMEVPAKVLQVFEAMGGDVRAFIADDVMSNAMAAIQPRRAVESKLGALEVAPGVPVGKAVEEELGLDIIENMVRNGIA